MGIDKGNTNEDVLVFDSIYGIHYPGVSGQDGGGNAVHFTYNIQGTPSIVIITPDKVIATHQINPPNTNNVVDSVLQAGGILQSCVNNLDKRNKKEEILTIGPNPARNFISLTINLKRRRHLEVNILDLSGQKVVDFNQHPYQSGQHVVNFDVSRLPEGFYFVQIVENDQVITTKKLVLSR